MTPDVIQIAEYVLKRYAASHPRPSQVTQKQAAEMLGISESTMSKLVKSGKIRLNKCGMVPISEVDAALTAA